MSFSVSSRSSKKTPKKANDCWSESTESQQSRSSKKTPKKANDCWSESTGSQQRGSSGKSPGFWCPFTEDQLECWANESSLFMDDSSEEEFCSRPTGSRDSKLRGKKKCRDEQRVSKNSSVGDMTGRQFRDNHVLLNGVNILIVTDRYNDVWYKANDVTLAVNRQNSNNLIRNLVDEEDKTTFGDLEVKDLCSLPKIHPYTVFVNRSGFNKICEYIKPGVVYCITTKPYEKQNVYKIGYSTNFDQRLANINATRMNDDQFYLAYVVESTNAPNLEKLIHQDLEGHRISKSKELFNCSLKTIIDTFKKRLNQESEFEYGKLFM